MRKTKLMLKCPLKNEQGIVLIAALALLAALTLVGATAFFASSTDVKVGGNYKNYQTTLQVAMAGAEKAREALRAANASSSNSANFSEELVTYASSPVGSSNTLVSGYSY